MLRSLFVVVALTLGSLSVAASSSRVAPTTAHADDGVTIDSSLVRALRGGRHPMFDQFPSSRSDASMHNRRKVKVFTTVRPHAADPSGFVDPSDSRAKDNIDSANDLRDWFRSRQTWGFWGNRKLRDIFEIVNSPQDADIRLTVLGRGEGSTNYRTEVNVILLPLGAIAWAEPVSDKYLWLRVLMSIGDFNRELVGTASDTQGLNARQVVLLVVSWNDANYDKVVGQR